MSGEHLKVEYVCVKCGATFGSKETVVGHLSEYDREREGCPDGRVINLRVVGS